MLRPRTGLLTTIIVLLLPLGVSAAGPNWQLTFRYDQNSLQLWRADRIAPTAKETRTPGLKSAPIRVMYNLDWLDSDGSAVYSGEAEMPLGIRTPFGADDTRLFYLPEEGVVVIRVHGPDERQVSRSIRLARSSVRNRASGTLSVPSPFETDSWTFPLPVSSASLSTEDGPISSVKIRDTGPDNNRLVVVITGDGYTDANLAAGMFESAAAGLGAHIEAKPPWDVLFTATNVYRIDVESNEEGADHEVYGVYKDTYFNSSYWVSDIERLLALTGDGYSKVVAAADAVVGPGVWDVILVLVNSTKYGGSGGSIAVSSVHSSASEIVLHELGHSFANLADEYETPYPGYPPGDYEPNVDFDYDGPGLKWLAWVEPTTPLPTPETSAYYGIVGTFEGARYLSAGIYRPWYNCEMRALGQQFCPICREAHVLEFTDIVSLIDNISPYPETSHAIDEAGMTFSTSPLPFDDLVFEWAVDGVPIAGEAQPDLHLTSDHLTGGPQSLELTITFATDLVRLDTIGVSYEWTVTRNAASCCTGIVGDANDDGAYEPTVSDVSTLIDHLFITGLPLNCYTEGDVNQSGGETADADDITIGDVSELIDYLFITGTPLKYCL